jgi:hypothetical protein
LLRASTTHSIVADNLALQRFGQGMNNRTMTVINVSGGEADSQESTAIIDRQMEFEAIKSPC